MSLEHIIGISLIAVAYGVLWYCVIRAKKTIEIINSSTKSSYPEILEELKKGRKDDGSGS